MNCICSVLYCIGWETGFFLLFFVLFTLFYCSFLRIMSFFSFNLANFIWTMFRNYCKSVAETKVFPLFWFCCYFRWCCTFVYVCLKNKRAELNQKEIKHKLQNVKTVLKLLLIWSYFDGELETKVKFWSFVNTCNSKMEGI